MWGLDSPSAGNTTALISPTQDSTQTHQHNLNPINLTKMFRLTSLRSALATLAPQQALPMAPTRPFSTSPAQHRIADEQVDSTQPNSMPACTAEADLFTGLALST